MSKWYKRLKRKDEPCVYVEGIPWTQYELSLIAQLPADEQKPMAQELQKVKKLLGGGTVVYKGDKFEVI